MTKILHDKDVLHRLNFAYREHKPFSLIRMCDVSNRLLSIRSSIPKSEYKLSKYQIDMSRELPFPFEMAYLLSTFFYWQEEFIEAVKSADLVGIHEYDSTLCNETSPQWQLRVLTDKVFEMHGISYDSLVLCESCVNRRFVHNGYFWRFLSGKKVALVSRWSPRLKIRLDNDMVFSDMKIESHAIVMKSYEQIDDIMKELSNIDYEIALVSTGVHAANICHRIKVEHGKIAIDFGGSSEYLVHEGVFKKHLDKYGEEY